MILISIFQLKELVCDGLVHIHRSDLSEQLRSWVNHQKHMDIMKAMNEIRRHNNSLTTDKVDQRSKAMMNLLIDGYDEYRYKIYICVLISSTLVTFIITKSIISAKSNSQSMAKARKGNSEVDQLV
ncbi:unnamed protein product [Orchesella dallaii]|uniref:Uncharacterized protein n=1 Tax=Orchesella dallaii TaxID=48710 RepID=A0ABP1S9L0_9HEXA